MMMMTTMTRRDCKSSLMSAGVGGRGGGRTKGAVALRLGQQGEPGGAAWTGGAVGSVLLLDVGVQVIYRAG
jgi:hypothetical protein